jgi:hypothetical protein
MRHMSRRKQNNTSINSKQEDISLPRNVFAGIIVPLRIGRELNLYFACNIGSILLLK